MATGKPTLWCRLFGHKLVIVRAGWPHEPEWFVRCDRCDCVTTRTTMGSPWREGQ